MSAYRDAARRREEPTLAVLEFSGRNFALRNARRVVRWNLKSHVENARACTRANAGLALARLPRQSFGSSREINARRCGGGNSGRRRGRAGERFLATIKDEAKIHRNECQFQGFSATLRSLLSPLLTLRALRVPPLSPRYPSCSSFSSFSFSSSSSSSFT